MHILLRAWLILGLLAGCSAPAAPAPGSDSTPAAAATAGAATAAPAATPAAEQTSAATALPAASETPRPTSASAAATATVVETPAQAAPPATSAPAPAGSAAIVLTALDDGSLRAIDVGTGQELVLGDPTAPRQRLLWAASPDGRSIALITGTGWTKQVGLDWTAALWTVKIDASQPRKLLNLLPAGGVPGRSIEAASTQIALTSSDLQRISWTQDGQSILVTSAHEGQVDLYLVAADGSAVRRLTETTDMEVQATLAPDGQELAYVSAANFGTGAGWGNVNAGAVPLGGGAARPLLDAPQGQVDVFRAAAFILGWTRDGAVLVSTGNATDGSSSIFVVPRGGEPRLLYVGTLSATAWSEQAQTLALVNLNLRTPQAGGQLLLWRVGDQQPAPAAGGAVADAIELSWAPQGQALLLCSSDASGGRELMLWAQGVLHQLGPGECSNTIAWSPGGRLATPGWAGAGGLVVDPDAGVPHQLPSSAIPAGWIGEALYYLAPAGQEHGWLLFRWQDGQSVPIGDPHMLSPEHLRLVEVR